jgi:FKBP-type peptidyl-prolyl cis-trans isomerase SlyD
VSMSYEIYDAEGELVEASHPATPLVFVAGYGQVAPGLEEGILGLSPGDARRVRLAPDEAFGRRDPDALIEVARDELPRDIAVGDEIEAEHLEGAMPIGLKILEITEDRVVLDANHPLSGQSVDIDVVVEDVRPATHDEIAAAEAALRGDPGRDMQSLLPAERLLKRELREQPPGGDDDS